MAQVPRTHYAENDGVSIAYQTFGEGPIDLLFLGGWLSQVEHLWEEPSLVRFFERLGSFSRVILMDRRGVGLSDRAMDKLGLEHDVADALTVLDKVGSERAAILGYTAGAIVAARMAAEHPDRVGALVLYAPIIRSTQSTTVDWTHSEAERVEFFRRTIEQWGEGNNVESLAPSRADDQNFRRWLARLERLSASPGTMQKIVAVSRDDDAADYLPFVSVPTLVLHRTDDALIDVRHGRFAADKIAGAKLVELPGVDNFPSAGDAEALVGEMEEFLTGGRSDRELERALLTVLFTDICDATGQAARLGDKAWRDRLSQHDACVRTEIKRFNGTEVKTIGDAFLIVFDGAPSRGVRCARAIVAATGDLGIDIRAGLHTGECELIGEDVAGMAVHIAARVGALASAGEVLASGTTYGTVVGNGFDWEWRGEEQLKGVPGKWPLFALSL